MFEKEITLIVERTSAEDPSSSEMREYRVPYGDGMTLLDSLIWIRTNLDPTLAFLYACRWDHACKLCQAEVNGETRFLCTTPAADGTRIKALESRTRIRDIVPDWPKVW